jgi:hypothetical protein
VLESNPSTAVPDDALALPSGMISVTPTISTESNAEATNATDCFDAAKTSALLPSSSAPDIPTTSAAGMLVDVPRSTTDATAHAPATHCDETMEVEVLHTTDHGGIEAGVIETAEKTKKSRKYEYIFIYQEADD